MANTAVRLIAPVLLGALILLFPADGLRALGLGEARVDSWLGQPLDVSIRLLEVEAEAIESVSVGPASLEDFERLGVPSGSLALGLEVTVDRRADPPIVRVRSQRPVNDPFVQILIDARWSNGRVLREYTLFLDPPVMESAPPVREVSQPASEPSRDQAPAPAEPEQREAAETPSQTARPAASPEQADETAPATTSEPEPATRTASTVAVTEGDTLWSLAQDWRPDSNLSMDQVMLAIFNRNRDAFLGENINRLRSDAMLDMPGLDDVRSVDRAAAEQRVRDHMRSWQPAVSEDVPVVSDAAMPDAVSDSDEASPEPDDGAAEDDEEFRLDVVPPEEDQYSESSAVAEGEIREVRDQLSDVEEEIVADGLESEAFDEHVAEIRDALEQRDMAGLAVAEESLAELETRLREAREARAEQERLAQAAGGEQATDSEEGDQIADYMRELEDEFGTQDGEEAADGDEEMAMSDDGAAEGMEDTAAETDEGAAEGSEAAGEQTDAMANAEEPAAADEAGAEEEEARPMAVTRTSGGMSGWLWPLIGLLILVIIVAVGLLWMRRRREAAESGEPSLAADDAVDSARASVARDPGDLAAHLALLKLLADRGREQEFTDAFDQMYQEVDDESAPEWQEALSLAAAHVPDHPLLTPREESVDDDFDRRADEMLGMLDVDDSDSDSDSESDSELDSGYEDDESREEKAREGEALEDDDFDLDLGLEDDEAERSSQEGKREVEEGPGKDESFDDDMDLAILSERLDDPSKEPGRDKSMQGDDEDANFEEFEEIDEYSTGEASEPEPDEHSEAPVDLEDDRAPGLDLDFEPSREQEADEVVGEAGARETEDLDLDLSSDVEDVDSTVSDGGLDFDLDEVAEPEPKAQEPAEEIGSPEQTESLEESESPEESESSEGPDSLDLSEPEEEAAPAAAAGGSLSNEDADVKLDLARAYISVDLSDSARTVLEEVISDGSEEKRAEAKKLLDSMV